jgi:NH3-dependent NAD+ synthetase
MSHYNVNGSVPKTLIQHLIRWVADREKFGKAYDPATIRRWLRVFLFRFFQISQFKR